MSKTINLGRVTAYADAVAAGYTGTREEFAHDLANAANYAAEAGDAAETATNKAEEASTAAETATTKAEEASEDADQAHADAQAILGAKETAVAAAATATSKAGEAANSAQQAAASETAAAGSATTASNAATSATASKTAAATSETNAANSANAAAQTLTNVNQAGATQVAAIQAKGTEVLNSIPADYTALTQEVNGLKSDLNLSNSVTLTDGGLIHTPLVTMPLFTQGTRIVATGQAVADPNWGYTDYIPIEQGSTYYLNVSGGNAYVVFYDSDKTYISGLTTGTTFSPVANAAYVIISVYKTRQAEFKLTKDYKYIDYVNRITEKLNGLTDTITPLQYNKALSLNLSGTDVAVSNGEFVLATSSNQFDFYAIACKPGDTFCISGIGGNAARLYGFIASFTTSDTRATIVSVCDATTSTTGVDNAYITCPEGGAWLVCNITNASNGYLSKLNDAINATKCEQVLAKALITEVIATENSIVNTSGGTDIPFRDGNAITLSNSDFDSFICPCNSGDMFILKGIGGSGDARLYVFGGDVTTLTGVGHSTAIKSSSPEVSVVGANYEVFVAPYGTKWAVFQMRRNSYHKVYKATGFANYVSNVISEDTDNHVRFMVFGNSYGCDAISYVPFILKALGLTCEIYLYVRDACTLRDIYNRWESADATDTETDGIHAGTYQRFVMHIDTRVDSNWKTVTRQSMKDIVSLGGWDFITLQQWSAYSIDPDTYAPWLSLDIDLINNAVDRGTPLAWLQPWTRKTHDDRTASISTFENTVYKNYPFDFVIPCGTAIFNARTNATIAAIGGGGNLWASDDVHLQDGLGCYIAACTVVEAICRRFFPKRSVMFDKTRPTDALMSAWNVPEQNLPVVGISDENCLLGQKAAIMAVNFPFEIKQMEFTSTPPTE